MLERPGSAAAAASLLAAAAADGRSVRPVGAGTKLAWAAPGPADVDVSSAALGELLEHNAGDLTAVMQPGLPLARAQAAFAAEGQMLALDPPDRDGAATLGGVVATADSGPLRHRYGGVRDLILGVQVALSDGTVARAGSKVIKNVAGYDLAKLMAGSRGTLGFVTEATFRLHPRPAGTATARGTTGAPATLAAAARALARSRLELESLDLRWQDGAGALLARAAGRAAGAQAQAAAERMVGAGLEAERHEGDDEELWAAQRAGQHGGVVLKVSGVPARLGDAIAAAAEAGATLVGRAALGLWWLTLPADAPAEAVERVRRRLAPCPCLLLDAPGELRAAVDPWGVPTGGEVELMRAVKRRFDEAGVLPGGPWPG
jgi:glycolate oxidase FAD binding subunit